MKTNNIFNEKKLTGNKEKLLAITFDDGPSTTVTPLVLDCLEKYGVPATFFVIGENLTNEVLPIIKRQGELGCEWGNHSWSHPGMGDMTDEEIINEIDRTNKTLFQLTGKVSSLFRPPYLSTSKRMFELIPYPFLAGLGCEDWKPEVDVQTRIQVMLDKTRDGDIFLLHDMTGNEATAEALDTIIPELQKQGYIFVTVSELFRRAGVNPQVTQHVWYNVYELN